nr:hypothetical protein [Verrucomicrobium spinosum]
MSLFKSGVLEKYNVRMIGAKADAIEKGEDRLLFKNAMLKIGLDLPQSGVAHKMEEPLSLPKRLAPTLSSSALPSRWAAAAAASRTTAKSSRPLWPAASTCLR